MLLISVEVEVGGEKVTELVRIRHLAFLLRSLHGSIMTREGVYGEIGIISVPNQ